MTVRMQAIAVQLLLVLAVANSQPISQPLGARLAPLVRNAIETALPPPAELSKKIWEGKSPNASLTRSEFERSFTRVRTDLRRDALIQLQPVSSVSSQLNAIDVLVGCAADATNALHQFTSLLTVDASWNKITQSWDNALPAIKCISGVQASDATSASPSVLLTLVSNPDLKRNLDLVINRVREDASGIQKDINEHNLAGINRSVRTLVAAIPLFYVIAAIQVDLSARDMNELAALNYKGQEPPASPARMQLLENVINTWPKD